ncbi:translation initiation factor IF-2-like [Canis lupus familiaris]|uniref:translation initiation factor IF-2-like n=1 Tax=Canis lupus familiaris TaxID=9615 RepID=UPI0018F31CA8|nr:translation initiation factor IF-2-like [Canis lupus familiaris]
MRIPKPDCRGPQSLGRPGWWRRGTPAGPLGAAVPRPAGSRVLPGAFALGKETGGQNSSGSTRLFRVLAEGAAGGLVSSPRWPYGRPRPRPRPRRQPSGGAPAKGRFLGSKKAASSLGGLEPPTSRLTAERANRLRHRDLRAVPAHVPLESELSLGARGSHPPSVGGDRAGRGRRPRLPDGSSLLSLPHPPWVPVALGSLPSTAVGAGELRWCWRGWSTGANAQGRAGQRGEGVGARWRGPPEIPRTPCRGSGRMGVRRWRLGVLRRASASRGRGGVSPPQGGGPAGDGGSSPAVSSEGTRRRTWNDFASRGPAAAAEPAAGRVARRDRIVVSTLRCGRSNLGSNPSHGTLPGRSPPLPFTWRGNPPAALVPGRGGRRRPGAPAGLPPEQRETPQCTDPGTVSF